MRTTATIENESDQNSRSEGSPTHEVHMHTGALLIICRRLSSSREESSPLSVSLSFSFYLLSLLSLLSHSRSRVPFFSSLPRVQPRVPVSLSLSFYSFFSFHAKRPVISVRLYRGSGRLQFKNRVSIASLSQSTLCLVNP